MSLRWSRFLFFVATLTAFTTLSTTLAANGYVNGIALHRWAEVVKVTDATEDVAVAISRSFPWLSTALLLMYRLIAGQLPLWLPSFVANLAAAILLTAIFDRMRGIGESVARSLLVCACIAVHPLFLWPATSGDSQALQLLFFFGLTASAMRVAEFMDARSLMTMAACCCLLLFADGRSVYILLAMTPAVPLLLPRQVAREGPAGGYMIVFLPLAMSLAACAYVGWATAGDPLLLYRSALGRNALLQSGEPWQTKGPGLLLSLLVIPAVVAVCFPVRPALLRNASQPHIAATVIVGVTVVAAVLAQADGALPHPASLMFYGIAPWACAIVLQARRAVLPACVGILSGWMLFSWLPTADMKAWTLALTGSTVTTVKPEVQQLGQYLATQKGAVLADDLLLAGAIAVRGHAFRLVMPGDARYRFETRGVAPSTDLVVMPHPWSPARGVDRVALRYRDGLPGYDVAWQNPEWQVYRKRGKTR